MTPTTNGSVIPESASALDRLVIRFQDCPDFRVNNHNKAHRLDDIIVMAICAVLGGANSWSAVERFAEGREAWFRTFLTLNNGIPSHDTFQRVFRLLNPEVLTDRFTDWVSEIGGRLSLKQIAVDGKTMCGSADKTGGLKGLHIVHAFATANGMCLARKVASEKSNEITAIPELLSLLDLKGSLVTIDAMGCQKDIAAAIVDGGGDYVLAVKGNQEHLHEDVMAATAPVLGGEVAPAADEYAKTEETSRGRTETRICYVITRLDRIRHQSLWKSLASLGVIITERMVNDQLEMEIRYFISSRVMSAHEFLQAVRDHWLVENQLHWVLDVVFGEDGHQLRKGHGPENFGLIRKLVHALIKSGNPTRGIKGTRELAGWDTDHLEKIISQAMDSSGKSSA
ncbi:ISAs1 family transposase [Zavarzinella formosa]|uniref:ISAs1 family transposase n=1 Tax=Zavarzinella formosa TaxID=360055 RepID=UPI0002ED7E0A|nr:ISAs1 family transposase [Zavarzinella formosa]